MREGGILGAKVVAGGGGGGESFQKEREQQDAVPPWVLWACRHSHGGTRVVLGRSLVGLGGGAGGGSGLCAARCRLYVVWHLSLPRFPVAERFCLWLSLLAIGFCGLGASALSVCGAVGGDPGPAVCSGVAGCEGREGDVKVVGRNLLGQLLCSYFFFHPFP